jgi:Histidine phosphatase superfamily (branch 1)
MPANDVQTHSASRYPLLFLYLRGLLLGILALYSDGGLPAADRPANGPRIVMIIRHAEKPAGTEGEKDPNLSDRGYERAAALAKVIPERFPKPDFLIATRRSKHSNRPVETVTPLATRCMKRSSPHSRTKPTNGSPMPC